MFQLCFHSSLQVTIEVETQWKQSGTMFQLPIADALGRKSLNARKALPIELDSVRRRDPQLEKAAPACGLRPDRRTPHGKASGFHSAGCDLQVCESARAMEKEG